MIIQQQENHTLIWVADAGINEGERKEEGREEGRPPTTGGAGLVGRVDRGE